MSDNNDPIVMYLVVRKSLEMTPGKIGSQTGHGVQAILLHYFKAQLLSAKLHCNLEEEHIKITTDWLARASRKVVLRADDKDFETIKAEYSDCCVIKDAGHTEVAPGSETLIALWPQFKSQSSKTLKRLQCL